MNRVSDRRPRDVATISDQAARAGPSGDASATAPAAGLPPLGFDGDPGASVPRVFLVDDDDRLRGAIRQLLEEAGIQVVGEAGNGTAALRLIPRSASTAPLVALMDVRMPGPLNGIDATGQLTASGVPVEVIVFTAFMDGGIQQAARDAGAVACLVKGATPSDIVVAIRRAWSAVRLWS